MGVSGSKRNTNHLTKTKTEAKNKNDRIKECILAGSTPFEKIDRHLSNVSKSICKIKIEAKSEAIIGTGFLLKFRIDQEIFYCLISNEHVIKKDIIKNNNNIYIFYDN